MANYTFDAGAQGWLTNPALFEWTNTAGSPGLGCLVAGDPFGVDPGSNSGATEITGLTLPMVVGDPYSCRARVVFDGLGGDSGLVHTELTLIGDLNSYTALGDDVAVVEDVASDSGWFIISGVQTPEDDNITSVEFSFSCNSPEVSVVVYLDSVYVKETPPDNSGAILYYGTNNIASSVAVEVT